MAIRVGSVRGRPGAGRRWGLGVAALALGAVGWAMAPPAAAEPPTTNSIPPPCALDPEDPNCIHLPGPITLGPVGGQTISQQTPNIYQRVGAPLPETANTPWVCHPDTAHCYGAKVRFWDFWWNALAVEIAKDPMTVTLTLPSAGVQGLDPNNPPPQWISSLSWSLGGGSLHMGSPPTVKFYYYVPKPCPVVNQDPNQVSC